MAKRSRYFRLKEDVQAGNWYLGDLLTLEGQALEDFREFTSGRPVRSDVRLTVSIREPGRQRDFNLAGAGMTPVVHVRAATLFAELAPNDVQLIPVNLEGHSDEYQLLVATKLVRCIDDNASSEVEFWLPEDERPDKLGQYRNVADMRIDPTKVGDAQVFRTWGWAVALIVSEDLKQALERAGITGAKFEEV
ncbi:imm11 family protein [Myxococcus stipitatus]|uniref:imm11 family protein n=1 Tax=Myxococcus stipitatus TaxID=83455 RepID=UPI0030D2B0F8